jgi:glutathione synthase
MSLKIAFQMDHVATVSIAGDTTFALALEAQRRGHELFHYTPDRLSMCNGEVTARVETMRVDDVKGAHFKLGEPQRVNLGEMDVVLLRQDPPFDMNYITTTHLLERIHPKTLVVNDPAWVRNSPEKIFVTEFADLMP